LGHVAATFGGLGRFIKMRDILAKLAKNFYYLGDSLSELFVRILEGRCGQSIGSLFGILVAQQPSG
jgi:hypothetical protein